MKKLIKIGLICSLAIMLVCIACEPLRVYPLEPEVSFKSISFAKATDTLGNEVTRCILTIHLIDGDGDLGLTEDTIPLFRDLGNQNLFIQLLKKANDGFLDSYLFPYRTPYLEPEGQDKSLVADFEVTKDFVAGILPQDTIIKFSFYIYDREKHMSNVGETPEFPSDTIGIIKPKKN